MKIKRVFTGIAAEFENLMSKVENHEAMAECAIAEVRQQTAKIHAQSKQVKGRVSCLKSRQAQLENKCEQWKRRVLAIGQDNREKGLRCVQAMQNAESEMQQISHQLIEEERLSLELQTHLQKSEQKLLELQSKKESLAARSARNRIMRTSLTEPKVFETDGIFNRWEQNVISDEYLPAKCADSDTDLDREFLTEETREMCEQELDRILSQKSLEENQQDQGGEKGD